MLDLKALVLLLAALADGYALYPRDLSPEASDALKGAGIDLSKPHVRPKQKVEQILAVGDSYTAGIGSNKKEDEIFHSLECSRYKRSWPVQLSEKDDWNVINDNTKPALTFGACSGGVMKDLREKQLKQGEPSDNNREEVPIGHPQLAVLTISGNDLLFKEIINDCIFRFPGIDNDKMKSCDQRVDEVQTMIDSPDYKKQLMETYSAVIKAGRDAGGADPPEAFQAFVGLYVGLFNPDDPGCNDVYWNVLRGGLTYKQFLTTDLRKKINKLIENANGVIKSAANDLETFGVFLVEGHNDAFEGRRFCEPNEHWVHESGYQDRNSETGFWSYRSRWGEQDDGGDDGEGPRLGDGPLDTPWDLYDKMIEVLIPNEEDRKKLDNGTQPWDVNPDLKNYPDIPAAIRAKAEGGDEAATGMDDANNRLFHPKGSAYRAFADKFMEVIASKRDKSEDKPDPPPKSKALSIVLEEYWTESPGTFHQWVFYETALGKEAVCSRNGAKRIDPTDESSKDFDADINNPPWAGGTYKFKAYGEDCEYKCDGTNAGAFFCPSFKDGVACQEDSGKTRGKEATSDCGDSFTGRYQHPVAFCEW